MEPIKCRFVNGVKRNKVMWTGPAPDGGPHREIYVLPPPPPFRARSFDLDNLPDDMLRPIVYSLYGREKNDGAWLYRT